MPWARRLLTLAQGVRLSQPLTAWLATVAALIFGAFTHTLGRFVYARLRLACPALPIFSRPGSTRASAAQQISPVHLFRSGACRHRGLVRTLAEARSDAYKRHGRSSGAAAASSARRRALGARERPPGSRSPAGCGTPSGCGRTWRCTRSCEPSSRISASEERPSSRRHCSFTPACGIYFHANHPQSQRTKPVNGGRLTAQGGSRKIQEGAWYAISSRRRSI